MTLIFGQLLAYAGSGINKVTADFGAGSNGVVCPTRPMEGKGRLRFFIELKIPPHATRVI